MHRKQWYQKRPHHRIMMGVVRLWWIWELQASAHRAGVPIAQDGPRGCWELAWGYCTDRQAATTGVPESRSLACVLLSVATLGKDFKIWNSITQGLFAHWICGKKYKQYFHLSLISAQFKKTRGMTWLRHDTHLFWRLLLHWLLLRPNDCWWCILNDSFLLTVMIFLKIPFSTWETE